VGIEIASLTLKSFNSNGMAPPPYSNWSLMEPSTGAYPKRLFLHLFSTHLFLRFCIPLLRMSKFNVVQGQRRGQFRM
jgi:hypothetical protein